MRTPMEAAQGWADLGVAAFPMRWRSKVPLVAWTALRDGGRVPHPAVRRMWFEGTQVNVGIVLWDGLTVVDFDQMGMYAGWCARNPEWAGTFSVSTARGVHAYFWLDEPLDHTGAFVGGDIKATGIVVVPPSKHPLGAYYRVTVDGPILRARNLAAIGIEEIRPEPIELAREPRWEGVPGTGVVDRIKAEMGVVQMLHRIGVRGFWKVKGQVMCCCPFHEDRHPSMQVWPEEGRCYCFVPECPAHRKLDAIGVYALKFRLTAVGAIAELAGELKDE